MIWSPLARFFGPRNTSTNPTVNLDETDQHSTAATGQRNLNRTLQNVVEDVVHRLGYVGALVATVDTGEELQLRAYHVSDKKVREDQISDWKAKLAEIMPQPPEDINHISLSLIDRQDQENLGVKASLQRSTIRTRDLHSLFTPLIPDDYQALVAHIQQQLGIVEIAALPFFLSQAEEQVGLLVVVLDREISDDDIQLLLAVGGQTASAIESEQRRLQAVIAQKIVSLLHLNMNDEQAILQNIVKGVVEELDFVGAIVATYEDVDDSLPVRALYLDPEIATMEDVHRWEQRVSVIAQKDVSITNPAIARVYMDEPKHAPNLSWKAVRDRKATPSDTLYDLFTPFVPSWTGGIISEIQKRLGIRQVVAVPFYINRIVDGKVEPELVGNLFAASRSSKFTVRELEMLEVFGEQAAIGIKNARLYQQLEERRKLAQSLGMEAFTSAGYIHELRNLVTPFQMLKFLTMQTPQTPEDYKAFYDEYTTSIVPLLPRLDEIKEIIENLNKPWEHQPATGAILQMCLTQAVEKGIYRVLHNEGFDASLITVFNQVDELDQNILIPTSKDLLIQAFVVVLQNSTEAIIEYNLRKKPRDGEVRIEADWIEEGGQTYIQVVFYDNGIGMKRDVLRRVYDLGGSTKKGRRGFALLWSRDYIEGLGGKIQIISRRGAGTVVQMLLPVTAQEDHA